MQNETRILTAEDFPLNSENSQPRGIGPVPANSTGLDELMKSAGISALSENSGPDEIIEVISKFLAITSNKDVVWLGIAKSELIKKLGDIGVKSPSKMVNEAMKTGKAETVEGQG